MKNNFDFARYPVAEVIEDVRQALERNKRVVLSSPAGSGKSTVLPLALLEEPWLQKRKIILLEPRRLAAYAVAGQLARNYDCDLGGVIGYRMRLDRKISAATRLEVLTEGMLTRKLQQDPELSDTGLIIFDEFHERSLQADLALALTLDAAESLRDDLRILVMSATLDSAKVAALLGDAEQIISNGKLYPVDINYIPRRSEITLSENMAHVVNDAYCNEPGSILAFLPGEADIKSCAGILQQKITDPLCSIIPLYGRLDNNLQRQAIEPPEPGHRKIVLATAIAESSLTIDGIRVVVDSGFTRIARYNVNSNLERLETVPITQDAAAQRAGRAGRTGPGVAFRLWSEFEETRRPATRPCQMSYCDLNGMFLELAAWGVRDVNSLKFIDPPPEASVQAAREYLQSINALDKNNNITAHGKLIHASGLSVRSGHLAAVAAACGAGQKGIKLGAILDALDPRRIFCEDINILYNNLEKDKYLSQACRLAGEVARRLSKLVPPKDAHNCSAAFLLAKAFPERVARRRGPIGELRYLLVGGRAAVWREMVNSASSEYIVALVLDDRPDNAYLNLVCPIESWEVEDALPDKFSTQIELKINSSDLSIDALELRKLGAVTWSSRRSETPDREQLCQALTAVLRKQGISELRWPESVNRLFKQLELVHEYVPDSGLPELNEEYILDKMTQILYDFLPEKFSKNMLKNFDWQQAIYSLLTYDQQRLLKQLLPEKIKLSNGREFKIDYNSDPPCIAGKLQWFFGVRQQPCLFSGKLPLPIVLESPAGRPVQTTSDIGNFWSGSYKYVRNDLKGRYPKHDWPENP